VRALVGGTGDIYSFVLESIIQAKPYKRCDNENTPQSSRRSGRPKRHKDSRLVLSCPDEGE
jgi:hypothetical protein